MFCTAYMSRITLGDVECNDEPTGVYPAPLYFSYEWQAEE